MTHNPNEAALLACFENGAVEQAQALLNRHPELGPTSGYAAHPLLRRFVDSNDGHCYKSAHVRIADFLTPLPVRSFRDAVLSDEVNGVERRLRDDAALVSAEFVGRGISQAIHHFRSLPMAKLLLDSGASLEVLTSRGESPVAMQVRFGSIAGVRFLLERGADPNLGRGTGTMASDRLREVIELLLEHGWDIRRHGALLHDANHGFGERVCTWLRYGSDPKAKRSDGRTALHLLAARGTGREAIRALVEAGADMNAKDQDGKSPLDLAKAAKQQAAARELTALGAKSA